MNYQLLKYQRQLKNIKEDNPELYYNLYILYQDIDEEKDNDNINKAKGLGFDEGGKNND